MLVVAAAVACGRLPSDRNQVIAIQTTALDSLEEYDTLRPRAVALDGSGDTIKPATIRWVKLDTVLAVVYDSDVVATRPGLTGRLEAQVGTLLSNPLTIRTLVAADILFAVGRTVDTVTLSSSSPPDSLSPPLTVVLADTVTTPTTPDTILLAGRPIVFRIARVTPGDSVTLVASDTTSHARVTLDTVVTGSSGMASVRVRLLVLGGSAPDTVLVTARAQRAVDAKAGNNSLVHGSPDTLVVQFRP